MMITPIRGIKTSLGALAAGTLLLLPSKSAAQTLNTEYEGDTFEMSVKATPKGVSDNTFLIMAPNPNVVINGEKKKATFVVDLSTNTLYHYDEDGNAKMAYLIASGKPSTPTSTGIRVVTHVERYPYSSAPASTKRRKNPWDYGPRIICLRKVDPKTGETSSTGEFIHGNNNPESLGKYASKGCMRMDNEVIKELAAVVKRGDIVLIQR